METRSGSWSVNCTVIVLTLCKMQTWAAGPGPVLAPFATPGLSLGTGTPSGALLERTPTNESVTLLQLMTDSLYTSSPLKQNWTGEVCNGNESSWVGVYCRLGKVASLDLKDHVNGGTLPPQLYLLSSLNSFACKDCSIRGTLPKEWESCLSLQWLSLIHNQLTGTLPPWMGTMPALYLVDLTWNKITGTLPSDWGSNSTLELVYLNNNRLTGTLPSDWGSNTNLQELYLDRNILTGTLPDAWGGMTSVATLSLSSNYFKGSIPGKSWAIGMQSLTSLYIQNNSLTGQLPAEWFSTANGFPSLRGIDIRRNKLYGPVPKLSNGSTFGRPYFEQSPKLYILPMDEGYGLCGESPDPGPALFVYFGRSTVALHLEKEGVNGRVTTLPSCTSGSRLPTWAMIMINIGKGGGGGLIGVVTVVTYIVMRVRRRKTGGRVGKSFLQSSLGSFKMAFPTAWHTPGGIAGRTASKPGKGAPHSGTSGLMPTSPRTASTGSGSRPLSTTDSGAAIDSARRGRGTLLSSSDRPMSKTSGLARHVPRGGMRAKDLIFATEGDNMRVALGSGAFGQVYKASWHGTDVAVKVFQDDDLEMLLENEIPGDVEMTRNEQQQQFENEVALLSTLRHPNIVNFLGFTVNGTDMMVVTELCDGGDLAKAMRRHRHTKVMGWYSRGAKLSLDVACGLAHLHKMGIIHYDIKPGNILLDRLGSTAKISDVGLSKSLATLQGTASNTVRGTFEYMAPELMLGRRSTFAVDIYSFGVMLREIITGEASDKRAAPPREPRIPEECPEAAWRLYCRCIDPDPSK